MKINRAYLLLVVMPLLGMLGGCAGTQTFTTAARAGETVALAVGYQKTLKRANMTVTITDASGAVTTYNPNDPKVKGVVNLYPDPTSLAVVGTRTGQPLGVNATGIGSVINIQTSYDPEWWQTTVLMDLPTTVTPGVANIVIANNGTSFRPIKVEVLPATTTSSTNLFNVYSYKTGYGTINALPNYPEAIHSMERADNSTITFSNINKDAAGNDVVPYSIQIGFTYASGVGKPWIINPNGDLKNISWSDDGAGNLKVIITTANGVTLDRILKQKFYIAGGITDLTRVPSSLKAYDINGTPMTGITATVTAQ